MPKKKKENILAWVGSVSIGLLTAV